MCINRYKNMIKHRDYNIELLRVIIMYFIVIFHFVVHGMKLWNVKDMPVDIGDFKSIFNYSSTWIVTIITSVAVNVYVLITGYYLGNNSTFKFTIYCKRFIKILIPTIFYSIILNLAYHLSEGRIPSVNEMVKSLFPIYNDAYWFVTKYIGLIALSPFLGIILNCINKRIHVLLVLIMLILTCEITPTIGYCHVYDADGMSILWFITLFITGSFINKYDICIRIRNNSGKLFIITGLLIAAIFLIRNFYKMQHGGYTIISKPHYNSIEIYILSILLLIWASKLNIKDTGIISNIAKMGYLTFGIYLIHDNNYVREMLWNKIVDSNAFIESWFHIPYIISISAVIFLGCALIEKFRFELFKRSKVETSIINLITVCYEKHRRK